VKKQADEFSSLAYMLVMRTTSVIVNEGTVDERAKNYLTEAEIESFLKAARGTDEQTRTLPWLSLN
jgi:hypothetical protein